MTIISQSSRLITRNLWKLPSSPQIRKMATSAPKEAFEWLVILPDQAGKYEKRMEVRPWDYLGILLLSKFKAYFYTVSILKDSIRSEEQRKSQASCWWAVSTSSFNLWPHLHYLDCSGFEFERVSWLDFIGALLEEVPKEGEPLKIIGSIVVTWATSREEVIEKLKKDIYAKNEVWDFEKVLEISRRYWNIN